MNGFPRWICGAGALLWVTGCDDPLTPVERVDGLRVLGARVELEDEPERAAPAPGENANVRWLVAAPDGAPEVGWAFAACVAHESSFGNASCKEAPFASAASPAPRALPPELALTIPSTLDPAARVAVIGSICEGFVPIGDPLGSRCPDGIPGTKVSLEFELAREGDVNTNPGFSDPAITLDGATWSAPSRELTLEDCAQGELPTLPAGSGKHALSIALESDARDALPKGHELDPDAESLLVSHFSSAGELERAFSSPAQDEPVRVTWKAPARAEGPLLVRFWFVVRDFRGGSDFTERALCVAP